MSGEVDAMRVEDKLWDTLYETAAARCCSCVACNHYLREYDPNARCEFRGAVEALMAHARRQGEAEVAGAFVAWAAKNEIAEPPLDWAWFGEITRRYSTLHVDGGTR